MSDLPVVGQAARTAREHRQDAWTARAQDATAGCDVVFVDPDNGLEVGSAPRLSNRGPKYVFLDDLKPYVNREQSLVIYHHLGRRGSTEQQVDAALTRVKAHLGCVDPFALVYHRGTARAFLIVPAKRHENILRARAFHFMSTGWSEHFSRIP